MKGKLYGDLTVACLDEQEFIVFGSGAAQEAHRRWFESHLGSLDVKYKNRSDDFHGLAIAGPRSRDLLQKIVKENVSNDTFKFRDTKSMFVAGVPAIVNRISFTGELGYEIYVAPHYQLKLYEEIENAGREFNIQPFGSRALMSMRLEKNWGAWTLDYRPDFTAKESGLDIFIDWNKDFIGKENAMNDDSNLKLTPLMVKTSDIDVTNNEAVMKKDMSIGYITSGGYAHYVQQSIAFSYLDEADINSGDNIQVEINGDLYDSIIINEPLYDPSGKKMRT
jgi:dimethylglycine dehydrogenase